MAPVSRKPGKTNQPTDTEMHLLTKIKAMKRTFMLYLPAIALASFLFTSCHPSRVWATKKKEKEPKEYREREVYRETPPPPPPRYYASASLIITPTPGFVMKQNPSNGRYYHRNQAGYLYWKGYDNRFYIDQSYLGRLRYSRWEYDEWKKYSRQSR